MQETPKRIPKEGRDQQKASTKIRFLKKKFLAEIHVNLLAI
jgi:hypothetical protein